MVYITIIYKNDKEVSHPEANRWAAMPAEILKPRAST